MQFTLREQIHAQLALMAEGDLPKYFKLSKELGSALQTYAEAPTLPGVTSFREYFQSVSNSFGFSFTEHPKVKNACENIISFIKMQQV